MKNKWEVIVGNVGSVYLGSNGFDARKHYNQYVYLSKHNHGRAGGEPVTLMKNDEIELEYNPVNKEGE